MIPHIPHYIEPRFNLDVSPTIYIAGSSNELDRVKEAQQLARKAGYIIMHDWVEQVEKTGSANDVSEDFAIQCATTDLLAAVNATVFWGLLSPIHTSKGMYVEIGARTSIHGHNRMVLSGSPRGECIFLAGVIRFQTDREAVDFLVRQKGNG